MFWLVRGTVAFVLLAIVLLGIGFLLPDTQVSNSTAMIDASPARVYEVVTDVEKQTEWRSDVRSIQVESRGDLWKWTLENTDGVVFHFQEKVKRPNERYEVEFESMQGGKGGSAAVFEPVGEKRTKLTFSQSVFVPNPFMRVVSYLLLNQEEQINDYLGDLSRRAAMQ